MSKGWLPIWENRPYPPLLMSLVTDSTVFGFKKIFPQSRISCGADYWQNGISSYLYLDPEIRVTVDLLFKFALKNPAGFFRIFKVAYQKSIKLNRNSKKYSPEVVREFSNSELIKHLNKFCRDFFDFYSYATAASWFGYRQDNPLYEKMNEILRRKLKDEPQNFADYLVILTNPPKLLKTNLLELELLNLARKAKVTGYRGSVHIKKHLFAEVNRLYEKYKCLSFDFTDKLGWDRNHFISQVAERVKTDIAKKIREIKNYEAKTKQDFECLCQKLDFSKSEIKIFNLVRNLGYYKWVREYEFQEALYHYTAITNELGRRCGLKTLQSRYVLLDEWPKFLANPKLAKKIAIARIKNCFYFSRWTKESKIYTGKQAVKEYQKLKFIKEDKMVLAKEIKGTPAFAGKVRGVVKIINYFSDLKKMKLNNILVSAATSPDLLTAMKKAAAIVTDEGGITCHAAIVSRELKIPCIVGTKIANRVFKDGDKVEVDANKGIIKRL